MILFIIELLRASSFIAACAMYKLGIEEEQMIAIKGAITGSSITNEMDLIPKSLFLFILVPDFLFVIAFLVLFWQLMSLFNQGHANLFKVICSGKLKYFVLVLIIVISTLQSTMLLLYLASTVSAKAFSIECTVLNFIAATFVWIAMLVFALIFSGSPYRSQAYKIKTRKMTFAIVLWCITRYFRGITGAFEQTCYSFVLRGLTPGNNNDMLAPPILCILIFVLEEVIPMLVVLDWSFMEIFVLSGDSGNKGITAASLMDAMRSYED